MNRVLIVGTLTTTTCIPGYTGTPCLVYVRGVFSTRGIHGTIESTCMYIPVRHDMYEGDCCPPLKHGMYHNLHYTSCLHLLLLYYLQQYHWALTVVLLLYWWTTTIHQTKARAVSHHIRLRSEETHKKKKHVLDQLLRGTIVKRTCGTHKTPHI